MCKAQTYPDLTPKDDMSAPPPICMPISLPQPAQAMPSPQMTQAMPPPQMAQAMPPQQMAQAVPLQQVLQLTPMVNTVQEAKFGTIGGKAHMKDMGPTFVLLQPGTNLTAVSCNSQFSQVVQCPNCRQTVNTTTRTYAQTRFINPSSDYFLYNIFTFIR